MPANRLAHDPLMAGAALVRVVWFGRNVGDWKIAVMHIREKLAPVFVNQYGCNWCSYSNYNSRDDDGKQHSRNRARISASS